MQFVSSTRAARPSRLTRSASAFLIGAIVAIAAVLSLGIYQYSEAVSGNIASSSTNSVQTNAQIEASDLSNVLAAKLGLVVGNLQILTSDSAVQNGSADAAQPLLDAAQNSTGSFTSSYSLIDQNGTLAASSNSTNVALSRQQDLNVTNRNYFVGAKETGTTYVGSPTISLLYNPVTVIVVARPVYAPTGGFDGVVTGSIQVSTLGSVLQSEVSPQLLGVIGLVGADGTVLYSTEANETGLNVFDDQFHALVPSGLSGDYDALFHMALAGGTGVADLAHGGSTTTVAYQPVPMSAIIPGTQNKSQLFGALYIATSDVLAANQASQISRLQLITTLIIGIIGASGVVAALLVVEWNKGLDGLVKERTAELVVANEKLAVQNEAQMDFVNVAAHELRTPIQPLLTMTELAKESMGEAAGGKKKDSIQLSRSEVDLITRNVRRLERLTTNILDIAKLDSGTFRLKKERLDLNQLARDVIAEATASLAERPSVLVHSPQRPRPRGDPMQIDVAPAAVSAASSTPPRVGFSSSEESLIVEADATRVFQVISNLLSNALKFSQGSAVEVSTSKLGPSSALVKVADRGGGIDPEIVPKLFTKFATKSDSGLGLGLFVSKSIVEAHGGKVWAENNQDGLGASFYFTLPLAAG